MEKKQVVGYARIGKEGALTGDMSPQIQLIKDTVSKRPEWEMAWIYTDEGVSGRAKRRFGFDQMINDAEAHKFDVIIVKRIETFSRDYEQARKTIQRLHELGIEVFFIADNVSSTDDAFKTILSLLCIIDEKERELLSERKRLKTT